MRYQRVTGANLWDKNGAKLRVQSRWSTQAQDRATDLTYDFVGVHPWQSVHVGIGRLKAECNEIHAERFRGGDNLLGNIPNCDLKTRVGWHRSGRCQHISH